ncbi:RHS repeat-associated core domain-containing protein [Vaginella massiliensis]|uniref:RHS repeat-associated core domain-containing protein n=1 Tax=Vaginella massiliensis TaxID=1816680 RepID=UPI0008393A8D|nr:RHS repeat-associated core domain-containing protein [Vaginella massiliensis]
MRQNHTATLASFDLEILNFQNLTRPFGLKHRGYTDLVQVPVEIGVGVGVEPGGIGVISTDYSGSHSYNYKYNGKELEDAMNFNIYDYHARMYDPVIGRFLSVDPLAEHAYEFSPYNYAYNDPINYIDSDGELPMIAMGAISAFIDLASQIIAISITNPEMSFEQMITSEVNYYSVGGSFITGMLGGGMGNVQKLGKLWGQLEKSGVLDKALDGKNALNSIFPQIAQGAIINTTTATLFPKGNDNQGSENKKQGILTVGTATITNPGWETGGSGSSGSGSDGSSKDGN